MVRARCSEGDARANPIPCTRTGTHQRTRTQAVHTRAQQGLTTRSAFRIRTQFCLLAENFCSPVDRRTCLTKNTTDQKEASAIVSGVKSLEKTEFASVRHPIGGHVDHFTASVSSHARKHCRGEQPPPEAEPNTFGCVPAHIFPRTHAHGRSHESHYTRETKCYQYALIDLSVPSRTASTFYRCMTASSNVNPLIRII